MTRNLLVAIVLATGVFVDAAEPPDLSVTPIARDGQVFVSFELSDGLTSDVQDAIQSGLATTFSYEVELRHGTARLVRPNGCGAHDHGDGAVRQPHAAVSDVADPRRAGRGRAAH